MSGTRTLLDRALRMIETLEARLVEAGGAAPEPVAITGMACRFPGGADSPEAFWRLLLEGRDAIGRVPPDRWPEALHDPNPDAAGRVSATGGGFLPDIEGFDAALFGITPREAGRMDPQQRMALELAWEALERAGLAPDALSGRLGGVFLGVSAFDWQHRLWRQPEALDGYCGTGTSGSVIAGRIAYQLGLTGPALALDTACSSSLVAVHLAVRALRGRECDLALAGGVNAILSPEWSIAFSRARMLSPDGRCRAFGAGAEGYGRAEGGGMLVLKRLSDAERDGDPILALIAGTAVNQDGRSAGLTAPNGPSQQGVIRMALDDARLPPARIHYVEAHGTGTALGDPIEAQAIAAALRPAGGAPLLAGSVKSNLGHLEPAAGVAGLIKLALTLRHATVPASLHAEPPNPHIAWAELPLRIATTAEPWPGASPRAGGVSAFGFSGTNAHAVLLEAPPARAPTAVEGPHLLRLSARSTGALRALAARWAAALSAPDAPTLADAAATAARGRAHLTERLALVAEDASEAARLLAAAAAGGAPEGVLFGRLPRGARPGLALEASGASEAIEAEAALLRTWGLQPAALHGEGVAAEAAALSLGQALRPPTAGLPVLRLPAGGRAGLLQALAALYVAGATDRAGPPEGRRATLPTYPFERPAPLQEAPVAAADPMTGYYRTLAARHGGAGAAEWAPERFLHFFPFPQPEPGFAWVRLVADPETQRHWTPRLREAEAAFRATLLRGLDLGALRSAVDIGCGYGTDLMDLLRAAPHLSGRGFTLSPEQARMAGERAAALGLSGRVAFAAADSRSADLGGPHDLALSVQVAHHVADKAALFANLARHLAPGGVVALAEVVAETEVAVSDPASSAEFAPRAVWAEALGRARLLLLDAVDASAPIANYLHDPEFEANLAAVLARMPGADGTARAHLTGPDRLGALLRRGLVRYLMLRATRAPALSPAEVMAHNAAILAAPEPFAGAAPPVAEPAARLAGPAGEQEVLDWLVAAVAAGQGAAPSAVDPALPLIELGVDSLLSLELSQRLGKLFGTRISAAALLESRDLRALARRVAAETAPAMEEVSL
jgi:3-oxoacyl-(acyl-carrier-protein) synthase/SAM-dependent methyltransferase/acyl carrier protein